jgi:hypothetical protein
MGARTQDERKLSASPDRGQETSDRTGQAQIKTGMFDVGLSDEAAA